LPSGEQITAKVEVYVEEFTGMVVKEETYMTDHYNGYTVSHKSGAIGELGYLAKYGKM
jgi:hypothetical protein